MLVTKVNAEELVSVDALESGEIFEWNGNLMLKTNQPQTQGKGGRGRKKVVGWHCVRMSDGHMYVLELGTNVLRAELTNGDELEYQIVKE
jgi:hypothetical protein